MKTSRWLTAALGLAVSTASLVACPVSFAQSSPSQIGRIETTGEMTQAEKWVQNRSQPEFMAQSTQEKKKRRTPVRSLAKGLAKELTASADGMAKDMVLIFSVQDIDPYEKTSAPKNRPAIVLKMNLVDGSSSYLWRFPDNSFAVEDGFADNTVLNPAGNNEYIVKYPNGVQGKVSFQGTNTILVHRPDKTITTFKKNAGGGYTVKNDKIGYMGEARPDRTGVHYELGEW